MWGVDTHQQPIGVDMCETEVAWTNNRVSMVLKPGQTLRLVSIDEDGKIVKEHGTFTYDKARKFRKLETRFTIITVGVLLLSMAIVWIIF